MTAFLTSSCTSITCDGFVNICDRVVIPCDGLYIACDSSTLICGKIFRCEWTRSLWWSMVTFDKIIITCDGSIFICILSIYFFLWIYSNMVATITICSLSAFSYNLDLVILLTSVHCFLDQNTLLMPRAMLQYLCRNSFWILMEFKKNTFLCDFWTIFSYIWFDSDILKSNPVNISPFVFLKIH